MKKNKKIQLSNKKIEKMFDETIINSWNIHKNKRYIKNLNFKDMKEEIYLWILDNEKLNKLKSFKNMSYLDLLGYLMGAKIIKPSKANEIINEITTNSIGLPYYKLKGNPDYQKFIIAIINYRIFSKKFSGGILEYSKFMKRNKKEKSILSSYITTTTEYFFRDSFEKEIRKIKKFLPSKVNVLIFGCATGTEVYSLTHILSNLKKDYKILAIDINKPALESAKKAIYPRKLLSKIPLSLKNELFNNTGKIKSKYQKNILFKLADIRNYTPEQKFDLILARNILKYFDEKTKKQLVKNIFENLLTPKGVVILGIQRGSNSDIIPSKYFSCKKIGDYSFVK